MVAAQKSNESALLEKREKVMLELDKLKRYDRKNLYLLTTPVVHFYWLNIGL